MPLRRTKGALLLDVREADEYAEVHAADARLIPLGQLESRLSEISSFRQPVAVMCRSGRRSARAVQLLARAGYCRGRHHRLADRRTGSYTQTLIS